MPGLPAFDMSAATSFGAPFLGAMTAHFVAAARTAAAMQALALDHACSELKAGLGEVEACARSRLPSEIVTIQARAFRRSAEAASATLHAMQGVARKGVAAR